ncbi:MAG: hypothetical protein AAB802_03840 [Patescibacteria group bacterium]
MKLRSHPAVVALITVIVIGAIGLLVGLFMITSAIDIVQTGHQEGKSIETFAGADGCMEHALDTLNLNSSYVGESITVGNVSCDITVTGSGTTRTVLASATLDSIYTTVIQVEVTISPKPMEITDWTETTN